MNQVGESRTKPEEDGFMSLVEENRQVLGSKQAGKQASRCVIEP